MKICIINGSPKVKESISDFLSDSLEKLINKESTISKYKVSKHILTLEMYDAICDCDALVFVFPVYIDAIPSHLLRVLIELQDYLKGKSRKKTVVYTIINCGFYEGEQTHIAAEMMENWCRKTGLIWGQSIGIGAGEMLGATKRVPLRHGPNANLGKALKIISNNILKLQSGDTVFISPNFPRFAWKICSTVLVWHPRAKANGLKLKDIRYKPQ